MNKIEYINKLSRYLNKLPASKKSQNLDKYINLIDKQLSKNSNEKSIVNLFGDPKQLADNIIFERYCDIACEFPSFLNIIKVIRYSYCIKGYSVLLYLMLFLLLVMFVILNILSLVSLLSSFYVFIITTIAMLNLNAVLTIFSYALCLVLFCLCPLIGTGARFVSKYTLNLILDFAVSKIYKYQG